MLGAPGGRSVESPRVLVPLVVSCNRGIPAVRSSRSIAGIGVESHSLRILMLLRGGWFACRCLLRRRLRMAALPNDCSSLAML